MITPVTNIYAVACICKHRYFAHFNPGQLKPRCPQCKRAPSPKSTQMLLVKPQSRLWLFSCACGNRFISKAATGQKAVHCPACHESLKASTGSPTHTFLNALEKAEEIAFNSLSLVLEKSALTTRQRQEHFQAVLAKNNKLAQKQISETNAERLRAFSPVVRKARQSQSGFSTPGRCRHCGKRCAAGSDVCYTCSD